MTNLINNKTIANSVTTLSKNKVESGIVLHIQLHEGSWVEERFFNRMFKLIFDFKSELNLSKSYTAKKLCGEEFWKLLEKGERIIAGKCIAHMVARKFITLDFAGVTIAKSRLYKSH